MTHGQRYLIDCRCQSANKPQKNVGVLIAYHAAQTLYLWLECFHMKVKKNKLMLLQSTMYSLMNSTQIWSLLCRWRLAVSEVENKTNISRDGRPLMMKCASHRNGWMQKDTANYDRREHRRWQWRGGGLAWSHLQTSTCHLKRAALTTCQMEAENFTAHFQKNRHEYC